MNQNTTKEATEAKMDHIIVISIKKGSIWAQLANFADSPFKGGCPSSDNTDRRWTTPTSIVLQTLGGYALMNQNTTKEATEAKMDHA